MHERADPIDARPDEAAALLDRALGLWRGPAYGEFADQPFGMFEANRLDMLRLGTTEARASLHLEVGRFGRRRGFGAVGSRAAVPRACVAPADDRPIPLGTPTEALTRYRAFRAMLAEELGIDPSPELQDLELRILGRDPALTGARASVPPAPAWLDLSAAFVGRERELAALEAAVSASRLVTVTGTGGVGKSRLVAESLDRLARGLAAPITIAELAAVPAGQVDQAVADALALLSTGGAARDAVVEYLSISTGVLILDNCEHLRAEVASLVAVLTHQCPHLRIIATSHQRLGVDSECLLPLDPLPTPDVDADPARASLTAGVRLFADRIRRARPSFGLTEENLPAVGAICRELDGLPLALELAASRAAVLGVGPVRSQLADTSSRDPEGSLDAVVDWS